MHGDTSSPGVLTLCVDVGYTNTRVAVWNGVALSGYRQLRTPKKSDLGRDDPSPVERREYWLGDLASHIECMRSAYPAIEGIGLCFPGIVHRDGTIWRSNSIWGTTNDDVSPAQLAARFGLPVTVSNDLTAAALRYGHDARFADRDSVLVLSVSSGIGAKLHSRRAGGVMLEQFGRNGEIGLAIVDHSEQALTNDNGRLKGVLGNYASGVGFTRLLRLRACEQPECYAASLLGGQLAEADEDIGTVERDKLNMIAVRCARQGDVFTLQTLSLSISYLARTLHTVILYGAPEALVVTGGFAASLGDLYRQTLVEQLSRLFTYVYTPADLAKMIHMGIGDDLDNLIGCGRLATSLGKC
jgi:predicted NBD/HSP70 family sugar kinase